ncbi:MAG TPA: electron transfer flavoprotein subunit beta/FixA family protein [Acidimicrobiia bacterium]|nr:electron transfer flavoprotein subunit beta/FixA family protein [Acidimicrobiia bacterium]
MRLLVCVKRVPAPGAKIALTEDGRAIETAHLSFTTSPHEECAVEAAIQLKEAHGGTVEVLTLGPPEAEEQLRYAASVGADGATLVPTDGSDVDPQATAAGLLSAIRSLEAERGPFDLVLFGNESADAGNFQVGIRVAHGLGRPVVSGIKGIEVEGETAVARRQTASGFEVYRLPLPAVLAVKEGIALPRYPTLSGRLKSKKLEVRRHETELAPGGQRMVRFESPPEQEVRTEFLSDAVAVVDVLEKLGVL